MQVYTSTAGSLDQYDVKGLALMDATRDPLLPNLPTVMESGVEAYYSQWMPLLAPRACPPTSRPRFPTPCARPCSLPSSWSASQAEPRSRLSGQQGLPRIRGGGIRPQRRSHQGADGEVIARPPYFQPEKTKGVIMRERRMSSS